MSADRPVLEVRDYTDAPQPLPGRSSVPFVTGLDWHLRPAAPFGPRAVVDADVIASEQVGEGEPGGGGPAADRAVGDQLAVAVEVGSGEDPAQLGGGAERPLARRRGRRWAGGRPRGRDRRGRLAPCRRTARTARPGTRPPSGRRGGWCPGRRWRSRTAAWSARSRPSWPREAVAGGGRLGWRCCSTGGPRPARCRGSSRGCAHRRGRRASSARTPGRARTRRTPPSSPGRSPTG